MKSVREFQEESIALFHEINEALQRSWTPFVMATDMLEEAGEVASVIKGLEGYKAPDQHKTREMLAMELSDLLYVIMIIASTYGVDLEKEYQQILESYRTRFLE